MPAWTCLRKVSAEWVIELGRVCPSGMTLIPTAYLILGLLNLVMPTVTWLILASRHKLAF